MYINIIIHTFYMPFHLILLYVITQIKVKVKLSLEQARKAEKGEQMYSSTLPSTSALNGVGGQHHALAALPPGKTR